MFNSSVTTIFASLLCLLCTNVQAKPIDPTQPFAKSAIDKYSIEQNFKLYSVIISGQSKKVIINNKTLIEGDTLGEFTLTKIYKNSAILTSSSETIELSLFSNALIK